MGIPLVDSVADELNDSGAHSADNPSRLIVDQNSLI